MREVSIFFCRLDIFLPDFAAADDDDYYARLLEQELEGLDDDQKTIAPGQAGFSAAKHIAVQELLKPSAASSIASSVFSDHDDPKPDDFMCEFTDFLQKKITKF